jgi:hypothetical protein
MTLWRHAAGQSTGSAHERLQKPCQDRFRCGTVDQHATLIAVVADGAGTAEHAHVGAEIAVDTMWNVAQLGVKAGRRDLDAVFREGAALARQRILEAAAERQAGVRDLACTLLAVAIAPLGGAAFQLGDGAIVTTERDAQWRCVFWPQKGEYANSTSFLSDENALEKAEVRRLGDDILDVALFSDGLEQLAIHFASRSAHAPFFRGMFAPLWALGGAGESVSLSRDVNTLLASALVRARTDDDATLVMATRRTDREFAGR